MSQARRKGIALRAKSVSNRLIQEEGGTSRDSYKWRSLLLDTIVVHAERKQGRRGL
jgi:hypothetical protein